MLQCATLDSILRLRSTELKGEADYLQIMYTKQHRESLADYLLQRIKTDLRPGRHPPFIQVTLLL